MIGWRCNAGNGISRPVLIARNLLVREFSNRSEPICVFQEKYCGGFSSVDPPLSIPNREVKRTYADGTDRPVGRVGSRRSSDSRAMKIARLSFFVPFGPKNEERRLPLSVTPKPPLRGLSRSKLLQTPTKTEKRQASAIRYPIPRPLPSGKGSQSLRSEYLPKPCSS